MADALQAAVFLAGYWYWSRHAPRSFGYVALALGAILLLAIMTAIGSGIWRAQLDEVPPLAIAVHHGGAEATVFLGRHALLMALGWWAAWLPDRARRQGLAVVFAAATFAAAYWARSSGIVPPFEDEAEEPSHSFFWTHEVAGPALLLLAASVGLILRVRRRANSTGGTCEPPPAA